MSEPSVILQMEGLESDVNNFFLVIFGAGVFFMHAGFLLISVGAVRGKNAKSIMMMVLLDACFAALAWYILGYGLAFGGTAQGFSGGRGFFFQDFPNTSYALWFFQWAFAATASTIVSGAVAERTDMRGYALYSFFLTLWVYPIVVHWMWSDSGWLGAAQKHGPGRLFGTGAVDFAGCSVIHMVGGLAGLAGAWIEGPRIGRFDSDNKPVDIPGHNTALVILGDFILWFGWYSFNCGSAGALAGEGSIVARTAVMTTLSAASGAISTLFLSSFIHSRKSGRIMYDVGHAGQGLLAGLVSITASCAFVEGWAAVIIGSIGGWVYYGVSYLVPHVLKVDDPLEAVAVHAGAGLWGLLATGFFAAKTPVQRYYNNDTDYGVIMGGDGRLLAANCIAAIVIGSWTLAHMVPFFWIINKCGWLRVKAEEETDGLDVSHHGGHYLERVRQMRANDLAVFQDLSVHHDSSEEGETPRGFVSPPPPSKNIGSQNSFEMRQMDVMSRLLSEVARLRQEMDDLRRRNGTQPDSTNHSTSSYSLLASGGMVPPGSPPQR